MNNIYDIYDYVKNGSTKRNPLLNLSRTLHIATASPQTLKFIPMARQAYSNQHAAPHSPGEGTRPRITPTRVRKYPPMVPVTHTPIRPTRHLPRELYQDPAICHHCRNYGPQGDICTTCRNPRYYYGNDRLDRDTLPLLARLMATAICEEDNINVAQLYTESLVDFYISEYYMPARHDSAVPNDDDNATL